MYLSQSTNKERVVFFLTKSASQAGFNLIAVRFALIQYIILLKCSDTHLQTEARQCHSTKKRDCSRKLMSSLQIAYVLSDCNFKGQCRVNAGCWARSYVLHHIIMKASQVFAYHLYINTYMVWVLMHHLNDHSLYLSYNTIELYSLYQRLTSRRHSVGTGQLSAHAQSTMAGREAGHRSRCLSFLPLFCEREANLQSRSAHVSRFRLLLGRVQCEEEGGLVALGCPL